MNHNIDIIAIQENRFYHPDSEIEYCIIENYSLVQLQRTPGTQPVAKFQSNPKTTVISCYCPHNARPEKDVDTFYVVLRSVLSRVPAHNFLSLLGDCNARLGPEDALFTYNSETNRNGEKRVDFMEEFNLVALNARFMKPLCKRHGHSSIQISKELS